jgi:hypothetical protein
VSYHRTQQAAHLKALTEAYKKGQDGYQVRWDDGGPQVGIVNRSFQSEPNDDGVVVVPDPGGTATLFWNTLSLPSFVGLFTGNPTSHNVRQYLLGTLSATAAITIVSDTGATGWSIVGNNLTHAGSVTGSGSFHLHAELSGVTADSPVISWSYVVPTLADWDCAESNGLHNGAATGGGNWAPFGGVTLNADPNADNYLQITHANDGWGGISSFHAQPAFISGATYSVTITIDGGGTHDEIWVQIGTGPAVEFAGTGGITHDVVSGSGTQNIVLHGNGQAANGATTRITAMSATGVQNSFNFVSPTYSVNEVAGTLEIGVSRSNPTAATASITVARTAGVDGVLTVTDTTLNWAVSEGGTKFSTLDINGDGQATVTISSPSVGTVGSIASSVITVNPESSGTSDRPRVAMVWIGHNSSLGGVGGQYQSATGIEWMRRRHLVIINRYPELEAAGGFSSINAIVNAVNAASTVGTQIFHYCDGDAVYKDSATFAFATKRAKYAAEGWYAYLNGTTNPVDSWFSSSGYTVNCTTFCPADSDGKKAVQWGLEWEWGWMAQGTEGNTPAPGLRGPFYDNQNSGPRVNADWNRDGVTDAALTGNPPWNVPPKTWYRAGYAAGIAAFRNTYPDAIVLGNVEAAGTSSPSTDLPEYNQVHDGGTIEYIVGIPDVTYESWLSTLALVTRLQQGEDLFINPAEYCIFMGHPEDHSATNYQAFRHFLALVLVVSNSAICWSRSDGYDVWDWYDEYDFNLGPPTETRRTSAESNGIWRRDYTNGIALWAPKNVTGTISLGGTFYVLRGNAAAFLTPGAAVTSVTFFTARDGIILSRTPT